MDAIKSCIKGPSSTSLTPHPQEEQHTTMTCKTHHISNDVLVLKPPWTRSVWIEEKVHRRSNKTRLLWSTGHPTGHFKKLYTKIWTKTVEWKCMIPHELYFYAAAVMSFFGQQSYVWMPSFQSFWRFDIWVGVKCCIQVQLDKPE